MRWMTPICAAALIAALAVGITLAATQTAEIEVRINARQLDDGRVEFALQQRDGDAWSDHLLPRSRFFPDGLMHNRWLNSTPLTVTKEIETAEAAVSEETRDPDVGPSSYGDTNAETANLWVYLWDDRFGLEGSVLMPIDLDAFDLDVVVSDGRRTDTYCNPDPIIADAIAELGCGRFEGRSHTDVAQVSATITIGVTTVARYRCTRQAESNQNESVWACWVRDN